MFVCLRIPDEWVTEKEYVPTKSVPISSLHSAAKDVLISHLFPSDQRRQERRRKPISKQQTWYKFFVNKLYSCKKSWVSLCNKPMLVFRQPFIRSVIQFFVRNCWISLAKVRFGLVNNNVWEHDVYLWSLSLCTESFV